MLSALPPASWFWKSVIAFQSHGALLPVNCEPMVAPQ
jgi:hypothetical protein